MIINYFAIVNLSAQIENFTTQNTKCLAKNLQSINTMCFTDSTFFVYLDKKSIYHLFSFYVLCQIIKSISECYNNSFVVNITRCWVYSKFPQIH